MTESELETVRLKLRLYAHELVLKTVLSWVESSSPAALQFLRESANQHRETVAHIALRGVPAEYSDLMAAEFQDAFDELLTSMFGGTGSAN